MPERLTQVTQLPYTSCVTCIGSTCACCSTTSQHQPWTVPRTCTTSRGVKRARRSHIRYTALLVSAPTQPCALAGKARAVTVIHPLSPASRAWTNRRTYHYFCMGSALGSTCATMSTTAHPRRRSTRSCIASPQGPARDGAHRGGRAEQAKVQGTIDRKKLHTSGGAGDAVTTR